jgi:hypothetical protein
VKEQSAVPQREISTSAAIALAQAAAHPVDADRDRLTPGCRFAGTLSPGDAYWFTGRSLGDDGKYMIMEVHRVIVVWGPRLDTTSDIFGRDLIRFWIWDPATGKEGSATFGPRGVVRVDIDSQYWVPAPGTLDQAAAAALSHHPRCECGPCRPDLAVNHHPDCQCTACQPGTWVPEACGARPVTHPHLPGRPWLVWLDGDLFGDFRTQPEQLAAVGEAAATGGAVATSHWDPDGYAGPGWTEAVPAHATGTEP